MAKPIAADIFDYYSKFGRYAINKPCNDPQANNQCAVRLSMALEGLDNGFLDDFDPQKRVHRDRKTCPNLPPHVLGAAELGRYLTYKWGRPFGYHGQQRLQARTVMFGRQGVVWFIQCYPINGHKSDHIDFWDGRCYMNEILVASAGGGLSAKADLFSRSDGGVRFWEM